MTTFDLEEREAIAEFGRAWWLFLVTGILWLLVAIIILRFDYTTVAAISILFGIVAIFAGVNEFFMLAASNGWWKVLHGLLGVIFVGVGIIAFIHPANTFAALAAVMSFFLIFKGFFDIVVSIATRDEFHAWWLQLVAGIIEVLIGFWAAGYWGRKAILLVIWVGVIALMRGYHGDHLRLQAPLGRQGRCRVAGRPRANDAGPGNHRGLRRSRASCGYEAAGAGSGGSSGAGSSAPRAAAIVARRAFVTSCAMICSDAVTGTATSAPSTPSSAPKKSDAQDHEERRDVHRLAVDRRAEQVVLDLLVHEDHREHDQRVRQPLLGEDRRYEDEARDRRPQVRDQVEEPCDDAERERVARAEQRRRPTLHGSGDQRDRERADRPARDGLRDVLPDVEPAVRVVG